MTPQPTTTHWVKAAREENTSGAPLPKDRKVTPAMLGESFRIVTVACGAVGRRMVTATQPRRLAAAPAHLQGRAKELVGGIAEQEQPVQQQHDEDDVGQRGGVRQRALLEVDVVDVALLLVRAGRVCAVVLALHGNSAPVARTVVSTAQPSDVHVGSRRRRTVIVRPHTRKHDHSYNSRCSAYQLDSTPRSARVGPHGSGSTNATAAAHRGAAICSQLCSAFLIAFTRVF